MALYIGTNYHPHDWDETRWPIDIQLMKEAGFTTVRLGHLCWDSYEPEDGVYTFEWFDTIMNLFAEADIQVLLDISMRPAPVWVHKLCPGCNIYGKSGTYQPSLRRYMEDVDDPAYQKYALRFAEVLVKRYKNHPALSAFGLCNELGDGYLSHSEYTRVRFIGWLKRKYRTVEALNEAWATRRWSRRLTSFDDVALPDNEIVVGPPEAWLDMRRFLSDGVVSFLGELKELVERNAPGVSHSSNHYADREGYGFDYLSAYDRFVDYPGIGFYPGYDAGEQYYKKSSGYMRRLAETGKPMWCLEFQTGRQGIYCGPKGALRMHGLLRLMNRTQMILGWTWRAMLGGEEQYQTGMLGHDGSITPNYYEYKQMATDMKRLEQYAFPYLPKPDIGVAYNYESAWVSQYGSVHYRYPYNDGMVEIHKVLDERNRDYNIVDLRNLKETYKVIIIPGHVVMEEAVAETIREFVQEGGTAVVTGYSATIDETGKAFAVPCPGRLEDVFGVCVHGFYRTDMEGFFGESALISERDGKKHELLEINGLLSEFTIDVDYYERLTLNTAESIASFAGKNMCAVSVNCYGQGKAYYVAAETNKLMLGQLIDYLTNPLELIQSPDVPQGVCVRKIADNQVFFINTTGREIKIPLEQAGTGVLSGNYFKSELVLAAMDGELIVS